MKRTHLELGGKAPVIVFDDADIDAVVTGLRAFGYYNAGQDCTAACRVYAGAKVYDRLVADLSAAASTIRYDAGRRHDQRDRAADLQAPALTASPPSWNAPPSSGTSRSRPAARTGGGAASSTSRLWLPARCRKMRSFDGGLRPDVFVSVTRFTDIDQAVTLGERFRLRACLLRVDPGCFKARWRRPPGCSMAAPGSTPISC